MGWLSRLFGGLRGGGVVASGRADFAGLTDPALASFLRVGAGSRRTALEVSAVYRCVSIISEAIGMLPLRLMHVGPGRVMSDPAVDHPLHDLLAAEPNAAQSAYVFKRLMQMRMLVHGDAYARIVRSGGRVVALQPLDPQRVRTEQRDDGAIVHRVETRAGALELPASEMLHLFDASLDGVTGLSRIDLAVESIGLSRDARDSLARIYRRGLSAGGALRHPNKLSLETKERLRAALEQYSGSANAGRWMVLDEGIDAKPLEMSARDQQTVETSRHQIEDIGRFFGVPRPLLGLDDTSWGSGVEQLAILFVRFALAPHFVAWEQAINRALLTRPEKRLYAADFDERELLRGSMKDQAEFFARALGAGGSRGWMEPNEVRDLSGLPRRPDGAGLAQQAGAQAAPPPAV